MRNEQRVTSVRNARQDGIDACSSVPLFLTPMFEQKPLGSATGFLWTLHGRHFLITNWHVVTGRNHETGKCLLDNAAIPDRIVVSFPRDERLAPPLDVTVWTVDRDGNPRWTEHPIYRQSVDVVALPIEPPPDGEGSYFPMNGIPEIELVQRIGMRVFILGFPFGRQGLGMPVWKQATFASEPFLSPEIQRYLIVDTASRPGMSGSPVIQREYGEVRTDEGVIGHAVGGLGACRFVGVYSGRFHTNDPNDAQLGRVWPRQLVWDIVEQACLWTAPT
ncbi:S1 family peptidase [Rhizorhabdus argentea]|uniref:S1 family peptidase n=1 Tax=Rhizorhabdus argentea TaxID=1387174 RepID=UPI0030EB3694